MPQQKTQVAANEYDIAHAFSVIENELLESMSRNLARHINDELEVGKAYEMWQAEQLAFLQQYRYMDDKRFRKRFSELNDKIKMLLQKTQQEAELAEESAILKKITQGKKNILPDNRVIDDGKLNALIAATETDFTRAEFAVLRMMDDQYRTAIFNAQVYLNTGTGTLRQAIDMATLSFYQNGIASIQYKNGARVNISSYVEMALRTANKRAKLQGEAAARDKYGEHLVIITRRGVACPKCTQFCGRVCIDDVYGSGTPDGKHPLLSSFIAGGLYHPNCKDSHTTYYEGISPKEQPMTAAQKAEAERIYELEQQQRYNERQIRKYKRLENNSLDPSNVTKYAQKRKEWQKRQKEFVDAHDELRRKYDRERVQ